MVNHYNVNAVADGEIVHSSDRGNLEGILREWTEARRMFPAATIRVERHSSGGKRVTLHTYTVVNGTTAAERRDRSVSEVLAAHAERMAQGGRSMTLPDDGAALKDRELRAERGKQ